MSAIDVINKRKILLKWLGGKSKICGKLSAYVGEKRTLIEPFVGSASVFLNMGDSFSRYVGVDNNSDLILLFNEIKRDESFTIRESKKLFDVGNDRAFYYQARDRFNSLDRDDPMRAVFFLYLNRHGFNGLCRYGKRKGNFNVPFGRFDEVYFPEVEIRAFHRIANDIDTSFICSDFSAAFEGAENAFIYADPPFLELSKTASFKNYSGKDYLLSDDERLDSMAANAVGSGNICVVSNHLTEQVFQLYKSASDHVVFDASRSVSCKKVRKPVKEVFMLYK